jgi:hypothetical protein
MVLFPSRLATHLRINSVYTAAGVTALTSEQFDLRYWGNTQLVLKWNMCPCQ